MRGHGQRRGIVAMAAVIGAIGFGLAARAEVVPPATIDTTTKGDWIGAFGDLGYILSNYGAGSTDVVSLPSFIGSFDLSGSYRHVWQSSTTDPRALQNPADPSGDRRAACWFGDQMITLHPSANAHFKLDLYFLSYDNPIRALDVTLSGGGLSGTDGVAAYGQGKWYSYDVHAIAGSPVVISLKSTGDSNAVISAVTFSSAASIPEVDPAGIGSVLALVTGALGLLERRRMKPA